MEELNKKDVENTVENILNLAVTGSHAKAMTKDLLGEVIEVAEGMEKTTGDFTNDIMYALGKTLLNRIEQSVDKG